MQSVQRKTAFANREVESEKVLWKLKNRGDCGIKNGRPDIEGD